MKNKIYAIRNPSWMADTFIFTKVVREDYNGKMQIYYPYIKINSKNKIEEIGVDVAIRLCCMFRKMTIEPILDKSSEATKIQKQIYRIIDNELWGTLISREQLKHI